MTDRIEVLTQRHTERTGRGSQGNRSSDAGDPRRDHRDAGTSAGAHACVAPWTGDPPLLPAADGATLCAWAWEPITRAISSGPGIGASKSPETNARSARNRRLTAPGETASPRTARAAHDRARERVIISGGLFLHIRRRVAGADFFEYIGANRLQVHQASTRNTGSPPLAHRWRPHPAKIGNGPGATQRVNNFFSVHARIVGTPNRLSIGSPNI